MTVNSVALMLDSQMRAALLTFLIAALEMPDGAKVTEYLPVNPFGDVDAYVRQVSNPLSGIGSAAEGVQADHHVLIAAEYVVSVRAVLESFNEAVAGGAPWTGLSVEERRAVDVVLRQLR